MVDGSINKMAFPTFLVHVSCYPKYGVQQIVLYMYMHICCNFFLKIIGCTDVHILRPPMEWIALVHMCHVVCRIYGLKHVVN
jgi:hypothetical protein